MRATVPRRSDGGYPAPWWDWETCDYLRNQKSRKDITQTYAGNCRKVVKNQILPYFGKTRLDKITPEDINNWLLGFKERKVRRGLSKTPVYGGKTMPETGHEMSRIITRRGGSGSGAKRTALL